MPHFLPTLIASTAYNPGGVGTNPGEDPNNSLFRLSGRVAINTPQNIKRIFNYNGALWTILWDGWGDEWDSGLLGTRYFRNTWSVWKSTNGGTTWTAVDWANRFSAGFKYNYADGHDTVVQVGGKLWLIYDYSEHIDAGSPNFFTGQFDIIRCVPFDMDTETWGTTTTTGGPERAPSGTALNLQQLTVDAVYRGGNEIVVYHQDTDATASPLRGLYSIFNTSSLTWSSLNTVVFTSSTAVNIRPSSIAYDGTYVHFFAIAGAVTGSISSKLHRTLTGSTLGAVGNMFASYPGSYPSLSTYDQDQEDFVLVFGGEVIVAQNYRGYDHGGFFSLVWQVLAMRATAGVAEPSWAIVDIGATLWDASTDFFANAGAPLLVESGGDLYAITPSQQDGSPGFSPTTGQAYLHTQKYLGSGSWAAPVELWSYREAYGGTGVLSNNLLFKIAAIGDLGGSGTAAIGIASSMLGYPEGADPDVYEDSVYWFRAGDVCCCADYAY